MQEIWKPVVGWEGIYEVSNLGKVRNMYGVILIGWKTKDYHYISLSKNGKNKKYRVHRLVAQAFIPNPKNLPVVNHIDENKLNNCVDNLEWCTQEENVCKYFGTKPKIKKPKIKDYHIAKPILQLDKNGNFIKKWKSMMEIERNLNIKSGNISLCCNGKKPSAKGYIWRYANK